MQKVVSTKARNEAEWQMIRAAANSQGLTVCAWARRVLLRAVQEHLANQLEK